MSLISVYNPVQNGLELMTKDDFDFELKSGLLIFINSTKLSKSYLILLSYFVLFEIKSDP